MRWRSLFVQELGGNDGVAELLAKTFIVTLADSRPDCSLNKIPVSRDVRLEMDETGMWRTAKAC